MIKTKRVITQAPHKPRTVNHKTLVATKLGKVKVHKINLNKKTKVSHAKRKSILSAVMPVKSWLAIKDSLSVFQQVCLK